MKRRVWLAWAVFGFAVVTLLPGTASAMRSKVQSSTRTATVDIRPVNAKGMLISGYHVTKNYNDGDCWTESIGVSDAYRCMAGNYIYDPCWAESGAGLRVVCLVAPWEHRVTRMNLVDKLPELSSFSGPAWGVQLMTGNQCVFLTGATGEVGGERINYGCTKNQVVLTGTVSRRHEPWRIQTAVWDGTRYVRGKVEPVKIVWDALPAVYR